VFVDLGFGFGRGFDFGFVVDFAKY